MSTQTITQRLANPTRFMALSAQVLPWLWAASAALIGWGLYLAFFRAPPDYQQGETVKIMFIHVPAAWLAMGGYSLIAISSFGLLVFRHPLADVSAKAAAPIGATFTALALLTGSLWGKPMWGAYWVWDARLTSVLILFFLYLGLMALRSSLEEEGEAAKLTAVLALVGVAILPVIKFSVDWWNTLHQPASVMRLGGSSIHASILTPLLVMAVGFTVLFMAMHLKAMRNEILRRRIKALTMAVVEGQAPGPAAAVTQIRSSRVILQWLAALAFAVVIAAKLQIRDMNLGPHATYIWLSYLAVAFAVLALIAWLNLDGRRHEGRLAEFEARGVRRRSAATPVGEG